MMNSVGFSSIKSPTELDASTARLIEISQTITANAVDIEVYNTANDSDGGQIAKNSGLNASNIIIAEATSIKIYDATNSVVPLTKTITGLSGVSSISVSNGQLYVGSNSGVQHYNMLNDYELVKIYNTASTPSLASNAVNDLTSVALISAPIDIATGLPKNTIIAATDGNDSYLVTVINDGAAYNIAVDGGFTAKSVAVGDDESLAVVRSDGTVYTWGNINAINADGQAPDATYTTEILGIASSIVYAKKDKVIASNQGLTIIHSDGSKTRITASYTAPRMLSGASMWLSDTTAETVVGGTDTDKSGNGNDGVINGTIIKTALASGAELVGFSNFSSSNYIRIPYDAGKNPGTGDFYIMGLYKRTPQANTEFAFDRGGNIEIMMNSSDDFMFRLNGATIGSVDVPVSEYYFFVAYREDGVAKININAVERAAVANTANVNGTTPDIYLGVRSNLTDPVITMSMACISMGLGAPSAEQIIKTYKIYKKAMLIDSPVTLEGASSDVSCLAYDKAIDNIQTGTTTDFSEFDADFVRVGEEPGGIYTTLSSDNSLIAKGN